jgi:hypothetical protein
MNESYAKKQGRREKVKAGGVYFRKWEKRLKKTFIFFQNRRKFEGYFLRKSEKAANQFCKAKRGYPP